MDNNYFECGASTREPASCSSHSVGTLRTHRTCNAFENQHLMAAAQAEAETESSAELVKVPHFSQDSKGLGRHGWNRTFRGLRCLKQGPALRSGRLPCSTMLGPHLVEWARCCTTWSSLSVGPCANLTEAPRSATIRASEDGDGSTEMLGRMAEILQTPCAARTLKFGASSEEPSGNSSSGMLHGAS